MNDNGSMTSSIYRKFLKKLSADPEFSIEKYMESAEQNQADAQFCIGICYANGYDVEISHEKAVEWYMKAAAQHHANALFCLGICHTNGLGTDIDTQLANEYLRMAAQYGIENDTNA